MEEYPQVGCWQPSSALGVGDASLVSLFPSLQHTLSVDCNSEEPACPHKTLTLPQMKLGIKKQMHSNRGWRISLIKVLHLCSSGADLQTDVLRNIMYREKFQGSRWKEHGEVLQDQLYISISVKQIHISETKQAEKGTKIAHGIFFG